MDFHNHSSYLSIRVALLCTPIWIPGPTLCSPWSLINIMKANRLKPQYHVCWVSCLHTRTPSWHRTPCSPETLCRSSGLMGHRDRSLKKLWVWINSLPWCNWSSPFRTIVFELFDSSKTQVKKIERWKLGDLSEATLLSRGKKMARRPKTSLWRENAS